MCDALYVKSFLFLITKGGGSVTPSGAGSNHTTPERERYAAAVAQQTSQSPIGGTTVVNVGTANGPSPASGRSSAHVSPRNSAATISPIRVGGGGASAAAAPAAAVAEVDIKKITVSSFSQIYKILSGFSLFFLVLFFHGHFLFSFRY